VEQKTDRYIDRGYWRRGCPGEYLDVRGESDRRTEELDVRRVTNSRRVRLQFCILRKDVATARLAATDTGAIDGGPLWYKHQETPQG
jgi:hypothetical protein